MKARSRNATSHCRVKRGRSNAPVTIVRKRVDWAGDVYLKATNTGPASAAIKDANGNPVPPGNLASGELKAGRSSEQIYMRIKVGVPGLMPPMGAGLSPDQVWSIVRYLEASVMPGQVASR